MKRIVIADDSATARMFVQRCLEIAGLAEADFVLVEDGAQALEALKESPTDLLVTDLTMPVMGGLDLVKRVSASPRLSGMPVMVVSSSTSDSVVQELEAAGAGAVLSKPIGPPVMIDALERMHLLEE
jgi:two-component system chemotaxis response regulator CheY